MWRKNREIRINIDDKSSICSRYTRIKSMIFRDLAKACVSAGGRRWKHRDCSDQLPVYEANRETASESAGHRGSPA